MLCCITGNDIIRVEAELAVTNIFVEYYAAIKMYTIIISGDVNYRFLISDITNMSKG